MYVDETAIPALHAKEIKDTPYRETLLVSKPAFQGYWKVRV